ncbi:hypothetical protein [Paludisphaera mucosa]|uniref:Lipoprotein n=1 Tax=Paludisphaera mucosa TaxID=3030827 RepID=A0ABT6F7C1_9BACT|nr:hypothetical protein [Paludisphaera mucosa]MDG3003487.1 hypothetical protein [Paludisphaera mucosa]
MDRPKVSCSRAVFGGILVAALLASIGCRSTKSEVPAGKPYARTGDQPSSVGFSSAPHPAPANTPSTAYNLGPGASADDQLARARNKAPVYGTPTAGENVARPTANIYGPPGTSGLDPTAGPSPGAIADDLLDTGNSAAKSLTQDLKARPPTVEQ